MSMVSTTDTTENRSSYKAIAMTRTTGGGGSLVMSTFGDVVAFAELMARSQHAIPAHLRNNPGACMAVTLLAMRLEIDPFALASKSYVTKEGATIAYEAQLFAAIVHTRAPIKRNPDYVFEGQGDRLKCTVTCEMNDGSVKTYTSPELGRIPVKNSPLWKGDPEQQIGYYSIRAWARRYCPEVILGIYTPDEMEGSPTIGPERARDVTPPRTMIGKLDALATQSDRKDKPTAAQVDLSQSVDMETGEVTDSGGQVEDSAGGMSGDAVDESEPLSPRDALLDDLRAKVMSGTMVSRLLNALPKEQRDLLTEDDEKALRAAAKALGQKDAAA